MCCAGRRRRRLLFLSIRDTPSRNSYGVTDGEEWRMKESIKVFFFRHPPSGYRGTDVVVVGVVLPKAMLTPAYVGEAIKVRTGMHMRLSLRLLSPRQQFHFRFSFRQRLQINANEPPEWFHGRPDCRLSKSLCESKLF